MRRIIYSRKSILTELIKLTEMDFSLTLCIISILIFKAAGLEDCTVIIKNGTIIGRTTELGATSKNVCTYTAIPFAAPPVGQLRFQAPQPCAAWDILNATSLPNWCPQDGVPPEGVMISEDCLYLNVYQPKSSNGSKLVDLPVMIWIHGGGFVQGSSWQYIPSKLLDRGDVIVVVPHYRLGLLGFLSTGDAEAPGNWGLKDQAHAIRWVNENIRDFGGNPNQVTIFGQSAGGASVMFQFITPLNKGLLHGVIAQSGTALSAWSMDSTPFESAQFMAKRLGCTNLSSSNVIVSCLLEVTPEAIIMAQVLLGTEFDAMLVNPTATVLPVVEPDLPGAFISEEPTKIMESGDIPQIPIMLGATKHDGAFILANQHLSYFGPKMLDQNPEYMKMKLIPELLKYYLVNEHDGNAGAAASTGLSFLPEVNRSSWNESMPGLVDFATVFMFKSSLEKTAQLLSRRGIDVYLYSFEHHSVNTLFEMLTGGKDVPVSGGITHGDELLYLFDFPVKFSETDQKFSELFSAVWINFGTFGNPTPNPELSFQWPTYDMFEEAFVKLNATPTIRNGYRSSWRPNGFEWN